MTVSINLDLFLTTRFVSPVPTFESSPKSRAKCGTEVPIPTLAISTSPEPNAYIPVLPAPAYDSST